MIPFRKRSECLLSLTAVSWFVNVRPIPLRVDKERPCQKMAGLSCALASLVGQGAGDGTKGITDLGSEQAHDGDHHDGDQREDDCVLNQTLTFFFGCG